MRNDFPKRPLGTSLHSLSKLYDFAIGFNPPHLWQCTSLFAVAKAWMLLDIG